MTQTSESYPSPSTEPLPEQVSPAAAVPVPTNTLIRLSTALVILPFVIFAWITGGLAFTLLIGAAFMIATLELVTIMREGRIGLTTWAAIAFMLTDLLAIVTGQPVLGVAATILGSMMIFALEYSAGRRDLVQILLLILFTLGLAVIGGMAILIRNQIPGVFWWLLIFDGTWGTDTLAFAGGHAYGKTPLLPAWSPKKTVEGTLTGVLGAVAIGLFILAYFKLISPLTLVMIVLTPFAAVIGDLLESRFKRIYHVKDSSVKGFNVMPGHGGILDRIDSLMAVIVVMFIILWLAA